MATSDELLELADRSAEKLDLDGKLRHVPSFSDAEEQCEDEYEDLLQAIHEDERFAPVDIELQETLSAHRTTRGSSARQPISSPIVPHRYAVRGLSTSSATMSSAGVGSDSSRSISW